MAAEVFLNRVVRSPDQCSETANKALDLVRERVSKMTTEATAKTVASLSKWDEHIPDPCRSRADLGKGRPAAPHLAADPLVLAEVERVWGAVPFPPAAE